MTITDPISAATHYPNTLQAIAKTDTKHRAIVQATTALEVTFAPPSADQQITVASGYGGNTHRPFVTIAVTDRVTQLDSATARRVALQLLEAADSAESDGFVTEWLGTIGELSPGKIGRLLHDFRAYRERLRTALARQDEEGTTS